MESFEKYLSKYMEQELDLALQDNIVLDDSVLHYIINQAIEAYKSIYNIDIIIIQEEIRHGNT
jgi:hypothetical protein